MLVSRALWPPPFCACSQLGPSRLVFTVYFMMLSWDKPRGRLNLSWWGRRMPHEWHGLDKQSFAWRKTTGAWRETREAARIFISTIQWISLVSEAQRHIPSGNLQRTQIPATAQGRRIVPFDTGIATATIGGNHYLELLCFVKLDPLANEDGMIVHFPAP